MKRWNLRRLYRGAVACVCLAAGLSAFVQNAYAEPTLAPSQSAAESAADSESPSPTIALTKTPEPVNPYADLVLKDGDSGDDVISLQMRLRDLGYYNYKITGDFGSLTAQAVRDFQEDNKLKQDGVVGGMTAEMLYANGATRSLYNRRIPTPTPTPTPKPTPKPTKSSGKDTSSSKYGVIKEWSEINRLAPRGSTFTVKDFYTGITYTCYRMGGHNHMDVEPKTKDDTAKMKKSMGGRWTWQRRPLLVKIKGTWYAASLYGEPHGQQTIRNNGMDGQVCIHFLNSRTHGTNITDPDHQRCIRIAGGKK